MNRAMFQSFEGKKELVVKSPTANFGEELSLNKNVNKYQEYTKAPLSFAGVSDYSTRRGVEPCFEQNVHIGRRPPMLGPTAGLFPQGGQSRTQAPAPYNTRPLNIPILRPRSSLNAELNTSLRTFIRA
jgi:hypothetical protein